jgi:hypothetical protein
MALFGGLRKFPTMLAEGVAKAQPIMYKRWGATDIDPKLPDFVISLQKRMVYSDLNQFENTAIRAMSRLIGSSALSREACEFLLAMICREIMPLITLISQYYNWPEDALLDIFNVALPNNVYKIENFSWLSVFVS